MAVRIAFVCYGNICRSPTAEFVMRHLCRREGAEAEVSSFGTHAETGCGLWPGMQEQLEIHGIPWEHRGAKQLAYRDYGRFDLFMAMDSENLRDMKRILGGDPEGKVRLLLGDRDLDDPYYTGDFARAYREIVRGCSSLLESIRIRCPFPANIF